LYGALQWRLFIEGNERFQKKPSDRNKKRVPIQETESGQAAQRGNQRLLQKVLASGHAALDKPKKTILDSDDEDFSQPTASNLQTS
jgi:hypothetical protein